MIAKKSRSAIIAPHKQQSRNTQKTPQACLLGGWRTETMSHIDTISGTEQSWNRAPDLIDLAAERQGQGKRHKEAIGR